MEEYRTPEMEVIEFVGSINVISDSITGDDWGGELEGE